MAQEINKEINIRSWVIRILKNWYWFMLSAAIFGCIGLYDYMSTTNKYDVKSEIVLRGADNGNTFIQSDLLKLLGMDGEKSVDDEIAVLTSRDAMARVIQTLDLQTEYRRQSRMRWVGQYNEPDLLVVYPEGTLDTLKSTIQIRVKVRPNNYVVKVKYGRHVHSKHVVQSLQYPIETCVGMINFQVLDAENVVDNAQYKITTYALPSAVSIFKSRIGVASVQKDSKLIEIQSTTDMPQRSVDIINSLINVYNADILSDKNLVAQNTAIFINERVKALEQDLKLAEDNAAQYLEKHGYVDPETEAELFLEEEVEYKRQMNAVTTQIHMLDFLCDFLHQNANKEALLPAIFVNPITSAPQDHQATPTTNPSASELALQSSVQEYNALILKKMRIYRGEETHATTHVDADLDALRENILTTLNNLRSTLQVALQDLERRSELANQYRGNLPEHVKTYDKLVRDRELKEDLYLFVCEKSEENALVLASNVMPIKVVSTPQIIPLKVSPKRSTVLLFILIGLLFPLGVMVAYDIMNNRVSGNVKDLEKRLQMPVLGRLIKNPKSGYVALRDGDNSPAAELFRNLRTNVQFLHSKQDKCPIILTTSGMDSEGKTYVATNLAIALAMLGKKVALVELNLRTPVLQQALELPSQGCLSNYLSDAAYTLQDTLVDSSLANLDVLPAGAMPANPSELLQSERLDDLFATLRQQYDYVVVDSAALSSVSDTYLLGRIADITVCATRASHTTFETLDLLNKTYEQARLPKMVAVLITHANL